MANIIANSNGTRFVIIPLRDDKKDLAYEGEIIGNWETGEVYIQTPNGFKNGFAPIQRMLNNIYAEANICVWLDGGLTGSVLHTTLDGKYNPVHLPGVNSLDVDKYTAFAFPGSDVNATIGDYWIVKDDCSITIQSTGIPQHNCHFDYLVAKFYRMKDYNALTYPVVTGSGIFQSHSSTIVRKNSIEIPTQATTNYRVFVMPTENTNAALGEVYVEKAYSNFVVRNTGDHKDTSFDFLVIGENGNEMYDEYSFPIKCGSGEFVIGGAAHVEFDVPIPDIPYVALVQPIDSAAGNLGEIVVGNKTRTGFDVIHTGSANASRFDWIILHSSYISEYNK